MGCASSGQNHLRRGEWGAKDAHPYCGEGQLGYMWGLAVFDGMVSEGRACLACIRTLERDAVQAKLDAVMLEHCPDEMLPEQRRIWEEHQKPAALELEARNV